MKNGIGHKKEISSMEIVNWLTKNGFRVFSHHPVVTGNLPGDNPIDVWDEQLFWGTIHFRERDQQDESKHDLFFVISEKENTESANKAEQLAKKIASAFSCSVLLLVESVDE